MGQGSIDKFYSARTIIQRKKVLTMRQLQAYSISIGTLGAVDTWITAAYIPIPVWVTFIAWASFFILGGKGQGLRRSIASNLSGICIASAALLAISMIGDNVAVAAVCVGIGSALMV